MSEIDQHICELLYDHDCVIVPQLGGFLASYRNAAIHPVQHTVSPPSRQVAFNVFLRNNDGLLADQLSRSEHTSYTEAIKKIEGYAATCQRELNEGKRVMIAGVGILYNDAGRNLQFEALAGSNFLRDSFGLAPIQHLPVTRDDQRQKAEKQLKEFVTIRPSVKQEKAITTDKKSSKKILSRIIVASAVVWLGVNVFLVLKNNKDVMAFLNPGTSQKELAETKQETIQNNASSETSLQPSVNTESTAALISIPETIKPASKEQDIQTENSPVAVNQEKNPNEKEIQAPAIASPGKNVSQDDKKYFIIAGAFSIPSNATSLVTRLQTEGFSNAHIVSTSHKLTLVCYDAYATRRDANQILDTIRTKNRDGWVFAN